MTTQMHGDVFDDGDDFDDFLSTCDFEALEVPKESSTQKPSATTTTVAVHDEPSTSIASSRRSLTRLRFNVR
jgi:hypothetical protein